MFRKLLIANRGEIAARIMRTAHRLGITCVAVYSRADMQGLHLSCSDEAYFLGESPAKDSYLNIEALIEIALKSGAQAIHPGYGFLSENALFAQACLSAGLVFIGPSVQALTIMGSKCLSKQHLSAHYIPLIPGYYGDNQSDARLKKEAMALGFPLMIKASMGGGGKGMRTVLAAKDLDEALASTRREAKAYFADETLLIEKQIQNPRHVEVQIMGDHEGNVVHLFDRDCSLQRRHQKIIEEAPAAQLSPQLCDKLTETAIKIAKSVDYCGAGTVEFLVEDNKDFYFMEMNTRLQVEHPVTEMITGIDLVEWQLRIAAQQPLPLTQKDIHKQGHAIECRLCAEDDNFLPSAGNISFLKEPTDKHLRLDTGIACGSNISMYYDPLMAKLIAIGDTREDARRHLISGLKHLHLAGVNSNKSFLINLLNHPDFVANQFDLSFLNKTVFSPKYIDALWVLRAACAIDYAQLSLNQDRLFIDTFGWQAHLKTSWTWHFMFEHQTHKVVIFPKNHQRFDMLFDSNSAPTTLTISCTEDKIWYDDGNLQQSIFFKHKDQSLLIFEDQGVVEVFRKSFELTTTHENNQLHAPMPGRIVALLKQPGESVLVGETVLILEAMKMEHSIRSPRVGKIKNIIFGLNAQVNEGDTLVELDSP